MVSLLVTNDFPPKLGGIQSYLYELWRRLPAEETIVLTTPHRGAEAFDAAQTFRVERTRAPVLLPGPGIARRIDRLASEIEADVVFVDPMLPLGLAARRIRTAPHVIVTHGAEVTLPGRVPIVDRVAGAVLRRADGIVAAGGYPGSVAASVAGRRLPGVEIPPGVDVERFSPPTPEARDAARDRFGLDARRPVVLGVSRLVPRKGFDVLIEAVAGLDDVQLAIAGTGRDEPRLRRLAERHRLGSRAVFCGRVSDGDLPALYGCADVFSMLCRDRWGGLEAEGFGIVFLEAAACGVAAVAGRSGGSHEAVADGETGLIVEPRDVAAVRDALASVLGDDERRREFGVRARRRAVEEFSYDVLVQRLAPVARGELDALGELSAPAP